MPNIKFSIELEELKVFENNLSNLNDIIYKLKENSYEESKSITLNDVMCVREKLQVAVELHYEELKAFTNFIKEVIGMAKEVDDTFAELYGYHIRRK